MYELIGARSSIVCAIDLSFPRQNVCDSISCVFPPFHSMHCDEKIEGVWKKEGIYIHRNCVIAMIYFRFFFSPLQFNFIETLTGEKAPNRSSVNSRKAVGLCEAGEWKKNCSSSDPNSFAARAFFFSRPN